jgi:hypothetical protein
MPTGYYGIPGSKREADVTLVHAVSNSAPICGVRLRRGMEFQLCAVGFEEQYIECGRCRRILAGVFLANRLCRWTR